jgi:diketogulonate reductase-like aldo/keto reductase
METKPFGWTGVRVPVVGQGTWHMGESRWARDKEIAALQLGLDLGLTHIDTAEMYGNGGAEEVIAAAIRGRNRRALFLVSKVLPQHASYRGTIRAAEQSLRRLGTDYLDLYLLHWESRYPIAETMSAMEDLVAAGKIRFLGVSNFDVEQVREAMAALTRERLACNQVMVHLGARGIERDLLPFCEKERIAIVGYTPFGSFPGQRSEAHRILSEIGQRHGKTPRQVVLRFLTRSPALFAIPKASTTEHVRENAGAFGFGLSDQEMETIDRLFPPPRRRVPLAMG